MSRLWSNDPQLDRYAPYNGHPPYVRSSPTSHAAANEIASEAQTLRAKVLAFIAARGPQGATDEEIQLALDMNPSTERPRRRELEQAVPPKIRKATFDRPTKSKRKAIVWIVTDKGRAA